MRHRPAGRDAKLVEQFSHVDALVAGLFDGVFSVEEVGRRGHLGLGCGDHMDGELVVLDGVFHLCHGDGTVSVLAPDDTLAFAEVVDFGPVPAELVEAVDSIDALAALVAERVVSPNLFHAVRFDAHFATLSLREAKRQTKPYLPLAEAVHDQRENTVTDVTGTLLGFVAPSVFQGISVAGPHFHFLDSTGAVGGHVLGIGGATGELAVETYPGVTVRLPTSPEFLAADLELGDVDGAIRHAESDHQR
ncbi:acetolactate decarboxylase [Herbiconiux sp. KACC 21604]|uniref:acetolactate decarboxylase n=1 Tax=unclassified Herbiconiux TaxID=2618217 RepID=UPI00149242A3|nr:acetolactate decarboxylase [Herbiconiux sp. SALV-R1]QJU53882.1 acetolactate decarboxylase [Herbiconiux sp. SALV-R1]WPO84895.1 acetolactate decarboxylase [Herbiconiux sp. KACC 21604]